MASTSLSKTFSSSSTNTKKFTYSFWFKPSAVPQSNYSGFLDVGGDNALALFSDNTIYFFENGGSNFYWRPQRLFRDSSAWYHIVIACDSTLATQTDRVKIYVNGVLETSFHNNSGPSQNYDFSFNTNNTRYIGTKVSTSSYFDGYMAEVHFVDGQQLQASDFGQTDSTGIWKSKGYSGTYGTNGFYLKFSNSGDLGADSSGNANNFTKSGNGRQMTDAPGNNFATWNPLDLDKTVTPTLSAANTRLSQPASGTSSNSNFGVPSGQWYFECKMTTLNNAWLGIVPQNLHPASSNLFTASNTAGIYAGNPTLYLNGSSQGSLGGGLSSGDIVMIAFDIDNGNFYVGKNGLWNDGLGGGFDQADFSNATAHSFTVKTGDNYVVGTVNGSGSSSYVLDINFGNPTFTISSGNTDDNGYGNFEYAPPTGYLALCTKNLSTEAAPTIDDGTDYFNTITYTANRTARSLTGVGFQPDWVWIKDRGGAQSHALFDSSRGVNKQLRSDTADAELTAYSDLLTSFDSDGFSLGADASVGDVNYDLQSHVAWNWNVNNGSTSSNTDGSITSTVQVNTTSGLSIVQYTGTGSNATVGHGLGSAPKVLFVKEREISKNWGVYHDGIGDATKYLKLNINDAATTATDIWNSTAPTSSVFSIGGASVSNPQGRTMIAYCFAEVEGYSKFGSYTGNGSTDGTFIYTGFKPAWLLIRPYAIASSYYVWDKERDPYNFIDNTLSPDTSNAEATHGSSLAIDLVSNGIKMRSTTNAWNGNGTAYIYMAFAEHPFVTSGGLPVTAR